MLYYQLHVEVKKMLYIKPRVLLIKQLTFPYVSFILKTLETFYIGKLMYMSNLEAITF